MAFLNQSSKVLPKQPRRKDIPQDDACFFFYFAPQTIGGRFTGLDTTTRAFFGSYYDLTSGSVA